MRTKKKIFPLDKYIYEALYNCKTGYYMKSNPFGASGDFITAPNITILFSEMMAIWIISFWEKLKCPKKFNLIELGAGNGEMMFQMIKSFNKFPLFKNSCKINILEKSLYLKKIQKQKIKNNNIKWVESLNEISNLPNIFIANEFFDALPIKQFLKKKNKWYEKKVDISDLNKHSFVDVVTNIKKIEKEVGFKISHNQKFIEYSPMALKYLKLISKKINITNGGILIIDYGYSDKNMKNTLQSISRHNYNDLLKNFSTSDITYNINFRLMKKILTKLNLKISGFTNQKNFLINLGILKRAEIISKNLPFSKKADIYFRLKRLIDNNLMGNLFKVILATNRKIIFKTGFEN
tara:strand:- start:1051 stop:2100 length:1050 start_codon:yes stop_codon:yes gene_type:complete